MTHRTTPDNITELKPHEVFVFGSNTMGLHGKGAAKTALKWGAKPGIGEGQQGRTYALPTKGINLRSRLPLNMIALRVARFLLHAQKNPTLTFLVTEVGCGLTGYSPKDIAPLFVGVEEIINVYLPKSFWRVRQHLL